MNILFTICGRAGSKGIKNKNIRDFLGYPLPFYTLSVIDLYMRDHAEHNIDICLNTDSKELIQMFEVNKICKTEIIVRDSELGLDSTPKTIVVKNCLEVMEQRKNYKYDMVVDLDITAPLRTIKDIENLLNEKESNVWDVVFSVTDSRRNPFFNMVKKTNTGFERVLNSEYNTRQEAPEIFDMNASMYAYSPEFLQLDKNLFDGRCGIIKMYDTGILDLDNENDFVLMEVIAEYLFLADNFDFAKIVQHLKDSQYGDGNEEEINK